MDLKKRPREPASAVDFGCNIIWQFELFDGSAKYYRARKQFNPAASRNVYMRGMLLIIEVVGKLKRLI